MKRLFTLLAVAALLVPLRSALAQEEGGAPIKVTTTLHSDGTQTVLKTDPDNHTAESTTMDASQKVLQRTVYAMDDQGQYLSADVFDSKDKLSFKSVFSRDSSGRVNQQLDTTPEGKPLRKLVFEYDPRGKLARVRTFDAAGNETTPPATPAKNIGSQPRSGSKR